MTDRPRGEHEASTGSTEHRPGSSGGPLLGMRPEKATRLGVGVGVGVGWLGVGVAYWS